MADHTEVEQSGPVWCWSEAGGVGAGTISPILFRGNDWWRTFWELEYFEDELDARQNLANDLLLMACLDDLNHFEPHSQRRGFVSYTCLRRRAQVLRLFLYPIFFGFGCGSCRRAVGMWR